MGLISRLKRMFGLGPGSGSEQLSDAQRTFKEGQDADDLDTAIAKFTEVIRLQPDGAEAYLRAEAYLHRGHAYLDKADPGRAIADFNEAICLGTNSAEAYHYRGRAYDIQGQFEKAKADIQRFDELSDPEVVRQLFKKYIPEIAGAVVEIKGIARIGGARTKVAVHSLNSHIDAVQSCVGLDLTRIKNIVDELGGERIDILRWEQSLQVMIPIALQPAQIEETFLYPRLGRAIVLIKKDQLSPAIGRFGQNARLASKLVGWDIEIMTHEELNAELERAENRLGQIPGITNKVVESLIEEGFFSYDDMTFLEPHQLAELAGVTEERAAGIILFAKEAAERVAKENL